MSPTTLREARSFRPHFSRLSLHSVALAAFVVQLALVGSAAADEPPAPTTVEPATGTEQAGEMLRWAGARFDWYHGVSLSALGVMDRGPLGGGDIGFYAQTFAFSGGFFLLKEQPHQLRVSTNISVVTELTDSDTTTKSRDPQVNDIPLRLTYTPSLYSKGSGGPIKGAAALYDPTLLGRGDHRTWGLVTGEVRFPTSTQSQGTGRILSTSLALGARQQLALLGAEAPGLTHVIVGLGGSWSHNFDKATTPVNDSLSRPRQSATGGLILGDQLSAVALVENEVGIRVNVVLSVYEGLQLDTGFSFVRSIPYSFSGSTECEVQTQTGCIDLPQSQSGGGRDYTSFDIGLSYLIVPEVSVAFGYENTAYTVGEDGKTRDPFYSLNSIFYTGLSISFDRFYQRFAEPENLAALLGEKRTTGTLGAAGVQ